ncbi:hypothetical protein FHU38_002200 [Saccharomonospora amisosensis]|uniref:Uncharacterized protein n=1 Tax=Saccharomonospora amisosensis TaxID=1128677 RepID=A0A7X5UPL5_9PSEU|nr:hypothetical protein [Saccharomonospora amisosensis]NIJ11856.1 hypothetical protein [Saccharomonospora amisosensis]
MVTATGPVRVQAEPIRHIALADGTQVRVLASYPVRPEADLFSIEAPIEFRCATCCDPCEATLVAVRDEWLVCPGCYASTERISDISPTVPAVAGSDRATAA